jgi:sugar phosphate isomerase/epimerase
MTLMLGSLPAGTAGEAPAGSPRLGAGEAAQVKLGWRLASKCYAFRHFTFFETVDKTAALGLKYIEVNPGQKLKPGSDLKMDPGLPDEVIAEIHEKLGTAGVRPVELGVIGLGMDEQSNRRVFEFARKLGVETIVSEPPQEALEGIDKLCAEYGINVAIHNHPKPSGYWDPAVVLKACRGRSGRIGACCDTGHWMRSGISPVQALRKLKGRIICLHFKDLNEFGDPNAHDVPWGTGKGNVMAVLAELNRQGVRTVFSAEYEVAGPRLMDDLAACVAYFDQATAKLAAK